MKLRPWKQFINSIAGRVLFGILLTMILLIIAFEAIFLHYQTKLLTENLLSQGVITASLAAENLRIGVFTENVSTISGVINSVAKQENVMMISAFNDKCHLLQETTPPSNFTMEPVRVPPEFSSTSSVNLVEMIEEKPGYFIFWSKIRSSTISENSLDYIEEEVSPTAQSRVLGFVAIAVSKSGLTNSTAILIKQNAPMAILFMLICSMATLFIVHSVTKPLRTMVDNFKKRSPELAQFNDVEFLKASHEQLLADLDKSFERASTFNEMLSQKVEERTKELALANECLEVRVQERTKELEETHKKLVHAAKLSAVGQLVASIAHEVNSPLCGIGLALNDLKRRLPPGGEDHRVIDLGINECSRMAKLIGNLKHLSKPSSGVLSEFDVHELLDAILLLSKKTFRSQKIVVERFYKRDLPLFYGDANQIHQVLLNIIQNAADSLDESQGGFIGIFTESLDENIAITIEDNGRGIPSDKLDNIYDPFFTTKPEVKGTGLGLSISLGIIKKHGGTIEVSSTMGKGTAVKVVLPLRSDAPIDQRVAPQQGAG